MKRFVGLFWKVCLLSVLFWNGALAEEPSSKSDGSDGAPQGPVLRIANDVHDFGKIVEGRVVSHDFKIENAGGQVLTIQKVRPG